MHHFLALPRACNYAQARTERLLGNMLSYLPARWARKLATPSPENSPTRGEAQLLVDVSVTLCNDARTGIQRVVRAWLGALQAQPPAGFRVRPVFASAKQGYRYAPNFEDVGLHNLDAAQPVQVAAGDVFLGLDLAAHLLPRWQFQMLRWKRAGVRVDLVVYDFLPLLQPSWFNPKTSRNFRRWSRVLAKYADNLICTAHVVATEVQNWKTTISGLAPHVPAVHVVRLGADIQASAPDASITEADHAVVQRLQARKMLLVVGTIEPRKGHVYILDALEHLWAHGHDLTLVFVGRPGWKTETLQQRIRQHAEHNSRLFWFNQASDELLETLYTASTGVLVPSLGEGFGLPLVEAMHYGKPLLVRDLPVFHETAGHQVTYFRDDSPVALAVSIVSWLGAIQQHGHYHYCVLSWKESYAQLLNLYAAIPSSH